MSSLPAEIELASLVVVLVAPRNPLNIGAAARAMSNFGFSRLRVVNPYQVAFQEARSAVGASALLTGAEEFAAVAEAVADCRLVVGTTAGARRQIEHQLKPVQWGSRYIRQELARGRVALLFGSEKRGLSNDDLSHCDWLMHIPTREAHVSMNLGQAVAICLYELVRDPRPPLRPQQIEPATAGDLERVTKLLLGTLRASGYLKPRAAVEAEPKLRRLIYRLRLTAADAAVCLGMLRKIGHRLGASESPEGKS
jgi:TrmH family RNA methyltransferase